MTDLPIETQVALLQNEVHSISSVFTRLDAAIERIGELSSNISKMLAVHEEKLLQQNNINTDLYQTIETRRNELETDIKELHSRITTTHRELSGEIAKTEDKIMKAIAELNQSIQTEKSAQDKKIQKLENYKWLLMGIGIAVGAIFTKLLPALMSIMK